MKARPATFSKGRVRIETRKLADLKPAPWNPRRISEEALAGLGASIDRFGLVQPIVVGRNGRVIGGHQRLRALLAKGVVEADCVIVDFNETDEKALNISLNNAEIAGEWTPDVLDLLGEILEELPELSGELRLDALAESLEDAFPEMAPELPADVDVVPEPPAVATSKRGDLYVLGPHRLLCGDATDADDVRRVVKDAAPRLLLTDPPYGVGLDMEWRDRAGLNALGPAESSYMRTEGHKNTKISGDTRADWSDAFALVPSLQTAYVWHASAFTIEVGLGLRRIGFELKQLLVWVKPHFALSRSHYHWQHEPCWYARKAGASPWRGSRDQSTVWTAASPKMLMSGSTEEKCDHPTQKPVALYTRPIANHLAAGEGFFEPFGGSGTGIIAAELTERVCLAIEIDPKFCDQIVARYEKASGKTAERIRTK